VHIDFQERKMNRLFSALAATAAAAVLAPLAAASPIASDAFDYAPGALGTANGGSGWTTNWAGGSTNVTAPGLVSSGVGSASTNKLTTNNDNNGAFRSLASQGADGTTVWLSYLTSGTGAPVAAGYAGVSLFAGGAENLFTGKRTNQTVLGMQRSGQATAAGDSTASADTTTHLLVYRIDFGAGTTAGNEKVMMYVDPSPGAAPDVSPSVTLADVTNFTFDRVRIQSGNGSNFNADEVSLGTTYADVVAPEPAMIGFLGLGAIATLASRRRRAARD
jgi:hypothetical protein